MKLVFSSKAEEDFVGILSYTISEFGPAQAQKYLELIDAALISLTRSPRLGHKRRDLPSHLFAYPVSQHLLIYKIENNKSIIILRVLHSRMDFSDRI